ncbi:MAG: phospholipase A2 [Pseudonocardia sp.]
MSRRPVLTVLLASVVAVLALLGAGGTALAHTGDAPATPSNQDAGGHNWSFDGCSTPGATVDRVPGVFDFGHACIHHDGCYQGLDRTGEPAQISRLRCDNLFLADMRASCAEMHPNATTQAAQRCYNSARLYYSAVRAFGGRFFSGSASS